MSKYFPIFLVAAVFENLYLQKLPDTNRRFHNKIEAHSSWKYLWNASAFSVSDLLWVTFVLKSSCCQIWIIGKLSLSSISLRPSRRFTVRRRENFGEFIEFSSRVGNAAEWPIWYCRSRTRGRYARASLLMQQAINMVTLMMGWMLADADGRMKKSLQLPVGRATEFCTSIVQVTKATDDHVLRIKKIEKLVENRKTAPHKNRVYGNFVSSMFHLTTMIRIFAKVPSYLGNCFIVVTIFLYKNF